MKRIKLPPHNSLTPEPIIKKHYKPNKKRTNNKRTKLVDKHLIADDIANQRKLWQMFH